MELLVSLLLSMILGTGLQTVQSMEEVVRPAAVVEVEQVMAGMSLEEKVGQLFLPHCPSGDVPDLTARLQPAGYILFASDFAGKDWEQVQGELASYQAAAKIPLFLAVDEEGGTVVRVSSNPALAGAPFDSPQNVYRAGGMEALVRDTQAKADLLLGLGLNLNLAPVCDVSTNPGDYIYLRSMGLPPEETGAAVAEIVGTMEAWGLSSALKHFPGYGGNLDTHMGISVDERPYEVLQSQDFKPFLAGIEAGAPSVLVSHNIVTAIDGENPASLSLRVHEVLREELGFEGVIMTDDLSMQAIRLYLPQGVSPAVQGLAAGNDLLLTADWEAGVRDILAGVEDGSVSVGRIDQSVKRILLWKKKKGFF